MGVLGFGRRVLDGLVGRRGYTLAKTSEIREMRERHGRYLSLNGPLALKVRDLIGALEIDCVLDVGANRGQYYEMIRREVGYEGLVVSYEPIPELSSALRERADDEHDWSVEACALGHEPGSMPFHVMKREELSSFLRPGDDQPPQFVPTNAIVKTIEVPVRTLEAEIGRIRARYGVSRFYLKLDTQGYDPTVLRGVGSMADRILAMQSEVSQIPLYDGMTDWIAALGLYRDAGFQVVGMYPVSCDEGTRAVIEFDCLLVRPERLATGVPVAPGTIPRP